MSLNILSASAGSGKTYRLTREFVRLCLQYEDPSAATSILAMTFTNKATAEMKIRILGLLRDISTGKENLNDSKDLLYDVKQKMGEDELKNRAYNTLRHLLKQYHYFNVTTIDSFFQKLIRQFQRELSLNQTMRVELDQKIVVRESIQYMLDGLDMSDEAFSWLSEWINDKLREDKSWDFRLELEKLGDELFKEGVTDDWDQLSIEDMKFAFEGMSAYNKGYDTFFESTQKEMKSILDRAEMTPLDFSGRGRSFMSSWLKDGRSMFNLPDTFEEKASDPEKWFSKANRDEMMTKVSPFIDEILDVYNSYLEAKENDKGRYKSYAAVLDNFRTYVALRFIYDAMKQWCTDNDVILLSESNKLVTQVVLNNDTTILYEKSGQRYKQVMVDEFQDTSGMQWTNIRPLIQESLATGQSSLIVGDIKQSIYRWRNGDWQIMYSGVEDSLSRFRSAIVKESLNSNWRSDPSIVNFNNQFFKVAAEHLVSGHLTEYEGHDLLQSVETIYSDVAQEAEVKEMKLGGVEVTIIDPIGEIGHNYAKYIEEIEEEADDNSVKFWLKETVDNLHKAGFAMNDITILVRDKKETSRIVNWFQEWAAASVSDRYKVISESGFQLSADKVVQVLIQAICLRINPAGNAHKAQLYALWSSLVKDIHVYDFSHIDDDKVFQTNINQIKTNDFSTLTDFFMDIVRGWGIGDHSPAHLSTFLDVVRHFEAENGNDPIDFINYWENTKDNLGIQPGKQADAVEIMTIHKSKGLQFKTVIVPFTDSELGKSANTKELIYGDAPEDTIIQHLGKVPVNFSSNKLKDSYFEPHFIEESILKAIDDLNLLYVAFTRSVERLHIAAQLSKPKKNGSRKATTGSFIVDCLRASGWVDRDFVFSTGKSLSPFSKDRELVRDEDIDDLVELYFRSQPLSTGSWMPKKLVGSMSTSVDQIQLTSREEGIILHEIMEKTYSIESLGNVLSLMVKEGRLLERYRSEITDKVRRFFKNDTVKSWYQPGLKVYAEKEIIEVNGKSYRPDRVILNPDNTILIDFKSGSKSDHHKVQLRQYGKMLERMNLPHVKAYLAYLSPVDIIEVPLG